MGYFGALSIYIGTSHLQYQHTLSSTNTYSAYPQIEDQNFSPESKQLFGKKLEQKDQLKLITENIMQMESAEKIVQ